MPPAAHDPEPRLPDWEAFYRDYRRPGYVPGFEITSKLGGGAFGLVFRARRLSIGKDYAIKFLRVEDSEVQKAVLAELEQVRLFAQIDHPNLVAIEDRGEVDGIPYLVMAFAGTQTLRDRLTGRPPASAAAKEELLRWFAQACRGLLALHERSLVHFDVKPANVFLKGPVARLGDYGLSRLVTQSRGSLSMGRGTPYYMAPELLQRRGDHRSDIYSAGVVLYEILCGVVPFRGDSEWEVLKQHETAAPAMPAHLLPREAELLRRCLQKDPAVRLQSVHDLLAALGAPAGAGAAPLPGAPPSPPLSAAPRSGPPPLPGAPEAGAAGRRATREAWEQASEAAQQAAAQAGRLARQAVAEAQRAVRTVVERSRSYPLRRHRALKRLGRLRAGEDRKSVLEVARAIAGGAAAPPRRRHRRGAAALAVGLVGLVLALLLLSTRPTWIGSSSLGSAAQPAAGGPLFAVVRVPPAFAGAVSTAEPAWAARAWVDPGGAREALLLHLERLRRTAPLSPAARSSTAELPSFAPARRGDAWWGGLMQRVESLLLARGYDREIAQGLIDDAPRSLIVLADRLDAIDWRQRGAWTAARRLQQVLVEATGCRDIELHGDERTSADELVAANRHLGTLWRWFINEFAHTPRAWLAFRSLVGS
jgi:hypothetical protein